MSLIVEIAKTMTLFADDTQLKKLSDGHYEVEITANWSIGDTPNGGYLMALAVKAMQDFSQGDAPIMVSTNYVGRSEAGTATLHVERIGASRQFDRLQLRASQNGKTVFVAWGTLMEAYPEKPESTRYEHPPLDLLPLEQCTTRFSVPHISMSQQLDIRLEPDTAGWMHGKPGDFSEMRGWACLKDFDHWDAASVAMICDAFPPCIFASEGMLGWVPTVEINIQLRQIPKTRWLKCRLMTRFIRSGLLEEDCELWDEEGNLVALSRQLSQCKDFKIGSASKELS